MPFLREGGYRKTPFFLLLLFFDGRLSRQFFILLRPLPQRVLLRMRKGSRELREPEVGGQRSEVRDQRSAGQLAGASLIQQET